ncbi:putative bacilliredoxin, YphP/YqiW family [Alicyclobacillus hesperidum]|uniref:Putative bacilliredoxin, YphP/YqiW family n=2 Tax=Alicyclobacillus hesperidum TaxID=89784 RepID=A0A1H2Q161_9BACL|nr:putative bacilliredoxin, YphP/YqiW family [Alicyclobacillus hesperidum]
MVQDKVRGGVLVSLELDFYQMMIQPMRDELTNIGFRELRTAEEVDEVMADKTGTTFFVVNSVCGCAGGIARPAVAMALENDRRPDRLVTVFAGQDKEATARAREFFTDMPPSSPSFFLFKDGELVGVLHRSDIEGSRADIVAGKLMALFDKYCEAKTN